MTDAHTPSPDDAADDEQYQLIRPNPTMIEAYLSELEELGFEIELAVIKHRSNNSPGTLTVQFREDEPAYANEQEET